MRYSDLKKSIYLPEVNLFSRSGNLNLGIFFSRPIICSVGKGCETRIEKGQGAIWAYLTDL